MAHIQTAAPHTNILSAAFDWLIDALVLAAESNSRMKRDEKLQAMSDAKLAQNGIKREDIVRHVFGDIMYV